MDPNELPGPEVTRGWWHQAACKDKNTNDWFPEKYRGGTPPTDKAKEICAGCVVNHDCLIAALKEEQGQKGSFRQGIRGGLTGGERAKLIKQLARYNITRR